MPHIKVSKFHSRSQGFTLVEIMIAVSIIAILTTIGLTVFVGLTKQARDSKRISDIDAIYNALELHYDSGTSQYPVQILPTWFASSTIPADPSGTGAGSNRCGASGTLHCEYCLRNLGSGQNECTVPSGSDQDISTNPNLPNTNGYAICASLEHQVSGVNYYCKKSARFNYN